VKVLGPRPALRSAALFAACLVLALLAVAARAAEPAASCPPPLPGARSTAAAAAIDRGLLWRLTRDGRSSYLYGTLHLGKPAWRRFGPRLQAALRASDVVALELDPGAPGLLQEMARSRPPQPLPDALQQRLARAYQRACVAAGSLALLHPLLQVSTLAVLEGRWLGLDPGYAPEQLLAARAAARGRRVEALESAAQQVLALVPDDEAQARAMLDESLQQLEDLSGRRVLARLAAAWEQGDLAALEDYARWCECADSEADRAYLHRLNDERNPALADGIEARHRQGRRVLAAVGALHMTGPQALPRLLALRGFLVERVLNVR
jgi:hypothetical protein